MYLPNVECVKYMYFRFINKYEILQSQQTQTSNQAIQLNNITDLLLFASCSLHVACIDSSFKRKIHTRNNHQKNH